jgi:aminomethyltransferase
LLHRTPLYDKHVEYGAKMVDFAGWEMPLVYMPGGKGSINEEHVQTRTKGGFFDVSHMGRLKIQGRHACRFLEKVCSRKIRDMKPGSCRYSLVCNEQGGVHDDVIVMRFDEDQFMMVVNASNRAKVVGHFNAVKAHHQMNLTIEDQTTSTAMVAIQGPRVMEFISKVSKEIPTLKRYTFATKNLLIAKLFVSRTGYTGEDGVEVILPAGMTKIAMGMLLKDVDPKAPDSLIKPCGLGARDTLRMEAGMPLYGHELGEEINALECGVDFAISLDKDQTDHKDEFIGMAALKKVRDSGGPARKLVGLKLEGKRSARQGMNVLKGDSSVGIVTSGCPSPTLGYPIAMAFVAREHAAEGTTLQVDNGKERLDATIVKLPFYKAAPVAPAPAKVGV